MADYGERNDIGLVLKPFYERASEAEDRLSRLEAALSSKKDARNEELLKTISELESKLKCANEKLDSKREQAERLAVENAKLQYRILHLVRAVRESDARLKLLTGHESAAGTQVISKLEDMRL